MVHDLIFKEFALQGKERNVIARLLNSGQNPIINLYNKAGGSRMTEPSLNIFQNIERNQQYPISQVFCQKFKNFEWK